MIKMIVCDMDGTLLNHEKKMPKEMNRLISQLHHEGIAFVAASGRQYYSLTDLFSKFKDEMYFLADNGCMVVNGKEDEIISIHEIDQEAAREFIRIARAIPDTYIVLSGLKGAYYESDREEVICNVTPYYHRHQQVDDLLLVEDKIIKLAVLNLHGTAQNVYPQFEKFAETYNVAVSAFEWMDIMPKGIHKGSAVCELQTRLGISQKETMAFGDFMNDYEMLQQAYFSFAMKNALPEIKKIARFETTYTNEEEGVLQEIEKWRENAWELVKSYE